MTTNNETLMKKFLPYQVVVIVLLALTQFTVVLDFMVMSPLGDMLMKSMNLKTSQFGFAVSSYAFSAGISGLLTAGFADKFDRKKLLLFLPWRPSSRHAASILAPRTLKRLQRPVQNNESNLVSLGPRR